MAYVILKHLGHQTVDPTAHIRQQHKNIGAVISRGERAFDGIHLSANPFDPRYELLFLFIQFRHIFLAYTLRGYDIKHQVVDKQNSAHHIILERVRSWPEPPTSHL